MILGINFPSIYMVLVMFAKIFFVPAISKINEEEIDFVEEYGYSEEVDLQCNIVLKYLSDYIDTQEEKNIEVIRSNLNDIVLFCSDLFNDNRVQFNYYMRKDNISLVRFSPGNGRIRSEIIPGNNEDVELYEDEIKYYATTFFNSIMEDTDMKTKFIYEGELYLYIIFADLWAKWSPLCYIYPGDLD